MNRMVTLFAIFAAVLSTSEALGQGMPEEVRNHIRDHMIGQWSAEGTWGEEKSQGDHRLRWAGGRSSVIERITVSDKDGEARQTNLWGWDPATKAIVVYGFSSRGDHFAIHFNDLSKDKWAGHGEGTFGGKEWKSPASIEWSKDSLKYEDTTDGKPFVLILKRKPKE